jgi:hypothetical protein
MQSTQDDPQDNAICWNDSIDQITNICNIYVALWAVARVCSCVLCVCNAPGRSISRDPPRKSMRRAPTELRTLGSSCAMTMSTSTACARPMHSSSACVCERGYGLVATPTRRYSIRSNGRLKQSLLPSCIRKQRNANYF